MKRSEMLLRISELIRLYQLENRDFKLAAESLLTHVEDLGMLPPACGQYQAVRLNPTGTKDYYTEYARYWEKE